jgi:hypothetical protein
MSKADDHSHPINQTELLPSFIRAMEDPRTRFARHVYDSQQALIRQLDLKAGAMIGILALLLTTTVGMAKDISPLLVWWGKGTVTSWAFVASAAIFGIGFFWTACWVQATILPRPGHLRPTPGHMYAEEIILHADSEAFHASLTSSSDDDLLRSLTFNIYELSQIAKAKIVALHKANLPTVVTLASWIVTSFLLFYISSWRR